MYSDQGYEKKTVAEIVREKEIEFKALFGVINNSISDIMWQWLKTSIYERNEIETIHEIATSMMSITTAEGGFLDKWGIECGIERKGETKAQGYVEVSTIISGKSFSIPEGTQFSSATQTYTADDDNTIPYEIIMTKTKTGESDDYFSSDISYVGSVIEILDENNNTISSIYYTFDTVYHNNIQWTEDSNNVIIENEQYTVRVSGIVTKRVEVTSVLDGVNSNATIGSVTKCIDYPVLTTTNEEEIDGGTEQEGDENYRGRLLQARRRTFTLGSIKSIVLGLEGVRSCKVYQSVGTDQMSVDDWDNPTRGSNLAISGTIPLYSQNFVPGDQIATLGRITLYGRPVNDPPAIYCGVKRDANSYASGVYFDYTSIEKYELEQTTTGERNIEFNLIHNNMDKSKTYRFDVWCKNPENEPFDWNTNHWLIATSIEEYRSDPRGELMKREGSNFVGTGDSLDIMFKTHFNGAGFNVTVATDDGYGFNNIKTQIETYLDYVEEGGYSPVCIQSEIIEADEILIDVKGTIYITVLADFQNVRREVIDSIETYLESLDVGENVVYSRIYHTIMDHRQVRKLEDLYIKRSTSKEWEETDIGILNDEIPDLGARSVQLGGVL